MQVAAALAQSLGDRGSWGLVVALLRQASHSLLGLSGRVTAFDPGTEYHHAVHAVEEAAGTASSIMLASACGLLKMDTCSMLTPVQLHDVPHQGRIYSDPRLKVQTKRRGFNESATSVSMVPPAADTQTPTAAAPTAAVTGLQKQTCWFLAEIGWCD